MAYSSQGEKRFLTGWWMLILALVVLSSIVLGALRYAGFFTSTLVERKVFEQSYQYQAGKAAADSTFGAQLVEIQTKLASPDLSPDLRASLEAKAASIRTLMRGNTNKAEGL